MIPYIMAKTIFWIKFKGLLAKRLSNGLYSYGGILVLQVLTHTLGLTDKLTDAVAFRLIQWTVLCLVTGFGIELLAEGDTQ